MVRVCTSCDYALNDRDFPVPHRAGGRPFLRCIDCQSTKTDLVRRIRCVEAERQVERVVASADHKKVKRLTEVNVILTGQNEEMLEEIKRQRRIQELSDDTLGTLKDRNDELLEAVQLNNQAIQMGADCIDDMGVQNKEMFEEIKKKDAALALDNRALKLLKGKYDDLKVTIDEVKKEHFRDDLPEKKHEPNDHESAYEYGQCPSCLQRRIAKFVDAMKTLTGAIEDKDKIIADLSLEILERDETPLQKKLSRTQLRNMKKQVKKNMAIQPRNPPPAYDED
jgi:hypothetical protein